MKHHHIAYLVSGTLLILFFFFNSVDVGVHRPICEVFDILLGRGSDNAAWEHIVLNSRLPQAITALLAGAALSISGLLLQTLFKNPLAGPSILGISDGANLGVAFVMLYFGGTMSQMTDLPVSGDVAIIMAAMI